ncbi:putative membrane protein (TIGR02226 family) [Mucilaginibacter yixingensis]|uniref:Putative membrane protein (TIGR02226 family) n=1 Tax=Mucilaginibacter yixingensis TaxID=1295612 RepID=A0A2T5J5T3_9SPHI|nr:BatA domain-containing protein [Mucilaginibacter yixingensis]PTQ93628.1 putative membrane protein (TIGR02226 family) [Mucilaginibacter yixingensis]
MAQFIRPFHILGYAIPYFNKHTVAQLFQADNICTFVDMHFLYPAFLFALVSLAIPVIVHLFNFRKYQKVYFSNVQFLKELQEQQASRRNLKERLILAARLLALLFLILAFARPYIPASQTVTAGKQQVASIFIDNSYSMQTLSKEGSLLDEAKHHAKEIAAAYGMNDRFQLLTQDFEGKHQRLLSRDEFNDAVDAVKISPQSRTLQQIVNRQEGLLKMQAPGSAIYILSDFQSNMGKQALMGVDKSTKVNFIRLDANKLPNLAVDSAWLLSAVHRPDDNEKLVVRLHNYSDEQAERVPLKLTINGQQKALGSFTIPARSVQNDTMSFSGLKAGWQQGELTLQDNPVTFDNRFFFTFNVKQQLPVLLINGGVSNPYLAAIFNTDKFFVASTVQDGNVDYAGLSKYPAIVVSDVKTISPGLAQQLKVYVNKGGNLVFFPAADADMANNRSFLQALNAAYPERLVTEPTRVTDINVKSNLFKGVFEQMPEHPDLPVIKKYYQLSHAGNTVTEGLMQLQGNQPFFSLYRSGRGSVYLSAVALTEDFSNLPRHALLLPMLFRIALLSSNDQPLFYTLGRDENIELPPIQVGEKQVLKLIHNGTSIIPDARQQEGSTILYISDQLKETGNYQLKMQDSTLAQLAFNDNRKESDLSYLTPTDLKNIFPQGEMINGAKPSLKSEISGLNLGTQLWKLCIILALIFLAAEIVLIRYFKTDRQAANAPV